MSKNYSKILKEYNKKGLPKYQNGPPEISPWMQIWNDNQSKPAGAVPEDIYNGVQQQSDIDFQIAPAKSVIPQRVYPSDVDAISGASMSSQDTYVSPKHNRNPSIPQQREQIQGVNALPEPELEIISSIDQSSLDKYFSEKNKPMSTGNMKKDLSPNEGKVTNKQNYNEFNPYAGVDIPSAANFLGQSIENKNPLGIAAGGLKTLFGVARNIGGGIGLQRSMNRGEEELRQNQKENLEGRTMYATATGEDGGYYMNGGLKPMTYYEQGGEMLPEEKVLTGEVMQGVSPNNTQIQPNAELERGEYVHSQDGSSIKIEGKDHEQGGEEMELKEGDRVISNNLQLKGENKKILKKQFDIEVSAKDTYAKAIDKIYNKIGLSKLIKEEESIIKKIKETGEGIKDQTTKSLNTQLLYKKLQDIKAKKEELEPKRQEALTTVFSLQEESKPKQDKPQEEFEDGGIMELSQRFNTTPERVKQLLEEFGKGGKKEYQDGGKFSFNVNDTKYEVNITDKGDAEQVKTLIETINKIRKDAKVGTQVSELPEAYKNAVGYLEAIVKEYDPNVDIQRALAGQQEVPGGKKGKNTLIPNQVYGKNNADAVYEITFDEGTPGEGMPDKGNVPKGEEKTKDGFNVGWLPDQGVLPPSGMASQLNPQARYDRLDPNLMSADVAIAENNRQAQAAIQSTQDLPDSQRAATIAQINANLQNANNQVITQVESGNAQIKNQTQGQNAQIQMAEENANIQNALGYEQRQQTAQALTEENVRQFYDYLLNLNAVNFNDERRRTTLNQMMENYTIDSLGNVTKKGEGPDKQDLQSMVAMGAATGVAPNKK